MNCIYLDLTINRKIIIIIYRYTLYIIILFYNLKCELIIQANRANITNKIIVNYLQKTLFMVNVAEVKKDFLE